MAARRGVNQLTWDDFPVRKEADGWHCRYCKILLTGRKTAWCSRQCLKEVLLRVEWRYIRRCILNRDKRRCVLCGNRASEVDHIIEMADGGSFHEWSNLRSLCHACHKAKTMVMRTARAAARKSQETPQKEEQPVLAEDGPKTPLEQAAERFRKQHGLSEEKHGE